MITHFAQKNSSFQAQSDLSLCWSFLSFPETGVLLSALLCSAFPKQTAYISNRFHQQMDAAHHHQYAAHSFHPQRGFARARPVQVGLRLLHHRAKKDDDAAMTEGEKQRECQRPSSFPPLAWPSQWPAGWWPNDTDWAECWARSRKKRWPGRATGSASAPSTGPRIDLESWCFSRFGLHSLLLQKCVDLALRKKSFMPQDLLAILI